MFILPLLAAAHFALAQTTDANASNFNHIQTGFNLVGPHVTAPCESCHVQGVFKGTPRDCATCHKLGNRMGAAIKPGTHVPTSAPCDNCHRPTTWTPATFSHMGVTPRACMTCHNGMTATGKPNGHILTTASCDVCHRTVAWIPAGYDHTGVVAGTCATCHNGATATGKPNWACCYYRLMRQMPQHHNLVGRELQPRGSGGGHMCDMPQRHDGEGRGWFTYDPIPCVFWSRAYILVAFMRYLPQVNDKLPQCQGAWVGCSCYGQMQCLPQSSQQFAIVRQMPLHKYLE